MSKLHNLSDHIDDLPVRGCPLDAGARDRILARAYQKAGLEYLDLSALHVSEDLRRSGVGRALFLAAADWARRQGARKLYISSHSALESQAFYAAMGCVDAAETNRQHVEAEPFDRQLEYVL